VPGKSEGTASITITGHTLAEVEAAIHAVFSEDRFRLIEDTPRGKIYDRTGSRMTDIAYGSVIDDSVVERARVLIHDEGTNRHRVECNVSIVTGKGSSFYENEDEVLKLFGGKYRRLLRQVTLQLD
jgi:hypothetical protein